MGVFDDKKFEQLDWMVQITETIEADINGLLARLPQETSFEYKDLIEHLDGYSLSSDTVVRALLRELGAQVTWDEENMLSKCFRFEVTGPGIVDVENRVLHGKVSLVKVVQTFTDEELLTIMGERGLSAIGREDYPKDAFSRMNEILDTLGDCGEALKGKSQNNKINQIRRRLGKIFKENEWRIRDMSLANKIGYWIADYIKTGNLASLTNFCKVKIMTHNNMPIYSVQEEL
jgi:hypothetical protein